MEARLIKDILPKFNRDLRDSKTFPYLEIFTHEDFPRVRFTREPKSRGTKLYGPFANPRGLRGAIQVLQKIFKFRTCSLDIDESDPRWQWFRPCLLHSIAQCTAPCNLRISKEQYRKDIHRLQRFLDGGQKTILGEMREEMAAAARERQFEEAARLRDEIAMLETLDDRGRLETHVQPEVFPIDPRRGLAGLRKVLHLEKPPRTIIGIDIAHLAGSDTVAAAVQFLDGLPFKPGYRRFAHPWGRGAGRRGQHPRGRRPAVPSAQRGRRIAARPAADRRRPRAVERGAIGPGFVARKGDWLRAGSGPKCRNGIRRGACPLFYVGRPHDGDRPGQARGRAACRGGWTSRYD